MLFAATDFNYMRQDRGRICYPEVDIKIPFTNFMYDLIDNVPNASLEFSKPLASKDLYHY